MHPRRTRLAATLRFAAVLLASLGLVVVAWSATAAWLVRSGRVARWLAARPDRLQVAFQELSSPLPGVLIARGLTVRLQTPRLRFEITAERAWGVVDLLALPWRELRFVTLRGSGVAVRGERVVLIDEAAAGDSVRAAWPPIAPFARPALPPRASVLPWSFELPDLRLDGVRELWLEELRIRGSLAGRGGFALRRRRLAEILPSRIELAAARVEIAGRDAGSLTGTLDLAIAPWAYHGAEPRTVLAGLDAAVDVRGAFEAAPLAARFLRGVPWIELSGPPAPFAARLLVEQGHLRPGSTARLRPEHQGLRVLDVALAGGAAIEMEARRDKGGDHCDVRLRMDRFEAHGRGDALLLAGEGLHAEATTHDLTLAGEPRDLALRFDLGAGRLPDLAAWNELLPPTSPLRFAGGSGAVRGSGEATRDPHSAHGTIEARLADVALDYGRVRLRGDVLATVRLVDGDLASRRFSLAGSTLRAERFGVSSAARTDAAKTAGATAGWWGELGVPDGALELGADRHAAGTFALALRDTAPLVALLDERRDLPRWLERALTVDGARASGRFTLRRGEIAFPVFTSRRETATADGSLTLGRQAVSARVLLTWKELAAGLELAGGRRRWHLRDATAWFAGAPPERR